MRTLIVLPTYNERETLPVVIIKLLSIEGPDILIVDDNSTDGTREVARHWVDQNPRVHLKERPGKLGLGTAYIEGFAWGLKRGYDAFMEMDSDLSHNPLDVPRFLELMDKGADLVIGSRYIGGTISVVGWDFKRLLLSRFGNFYASTILRCPLSDMTSGFRAFSRRALKSLDLDAIHSEGYAFQIEMAYYLWRLGMDVRDIQIIFTERARGISKMSKSIVREAVALPWRIRLRELMGRAAYQRRKEKTADTKEAAPDGEEKNP